jgi:oxygen-independent coproporphyrinogen-3 oxidase
MNKEHGIYIHIPFCSHACSYCDFHFSTQTHYVSEMCSAIRSELKLRTQEWLDKKIISIYFGGGTPGLLPFSELESFFKNFNDFGWLRTAKEITLEVNPENVTADSVRAWNGLGINRISLGLQSLKNEDLQWMRRSHTIAQSINSVEILKKHFKGGFSIDLIFGTPHKNLRDLEKELDFVLKNEINHISCYQLTVEDKTLLKKEVERKKIILPSEDIIAEQFIFIHDFLTSNGYEHYEISNYAKPGHRSVHNSNYWKGNSYSGFGPSAHSYDGHRKRKKNISNNHEYLRRISENEAWFEVEILNDRNYWNDYVLTRLRTSDGFKSDEVKNLFSSSHLEYIINKLKNMPSDWFCDYETNISLTGKGMLYADFVAERLFF